MRVVADSHPIFWYLLLVPPRFGPVVVRWKLYWASTPPERPRVAGPASSPASRRSPTGPDAPASSPSLRHRQPLRAHAAPTPRPLALGPPVPHRPHRDPSASSPIGLPPPPGPDPTPPSPESTTEPVTIRTPASTRPRSSHPSSALPEPLNRPGIPATAGETVDSRSIHRHGPALPARRGDGLLARVRCLCRSPCRAGLQASRGLGRAPTSAGSSLSPGSTGGGSVSRSFP